MKKTYYTVEVKYFSTTHEFFEPEETPEIKSKTAAAAMKRAKAAQDKYGITATRIIKVTREVISKKSIRKDGTK